MTTTHITLNHESSRIPLLAVICTTLVFASAFLMVFIWGGPLLSHIYSGKSIPLLNSLINHRFNYPLTHYYTRSVQILTISYFISIASVFLIFMPVRVKKLLNNNFRTILILLSTFYFCLVLFMVWNPDFFTKPIFMDDYVIHYAEGQAECDYITGYGVNWGYDVTRNAGRINNGNDNFLPSLFFLLFGWTHNTAFVFNLSVLFTLLLPLLLSYLVSINLKLSKVQQIISLSLHIALLSGFRDIKNFYISGCTGFIVSSYLSLYVWSLMIRYFDDNKRRFLLGATLTGSIALWLHPLTGLTSLALLLPLVIFSFKKCSRKVLIELSAGLLFVLTTNLPWILHLLTQGRLHESLSDTYLQTRAVYLSTSIKENSSLLILGILFLFFVIDGIRTRSDDHFGYLSVSVLLIALIAFRGSQIGLGYAEPARYSIVLGILLAYCAIKLFERNFNKKYYIVLIATLFIFTIKPVFRFKFGIPEDGMKIISYIKQHVPKDTRVLVEESIQGHPYFDMHFSSIIPYYTGREVLANSGHAYQLNFPRFSRDSMFGIDLQQISDSVLAEYFTLYNISHILVYEDKARTFFLSRKDFKSVFTTGPYDLIEYNDPESGFCLNCEATIEAQHGKISIKQSNSKSFIIKYHYYKLLKVTPDTIQIEPVMLLNDPIPFIRVLNAGNTPFTIHQ